MPLGGEIGLGPGHIVLNGDQLSPTERYTAAPPSHTQTFWPMSVVAKRSPVLAAAELMLKMDINTFKASHGCSFIDVKREDMTSLSMIDILKCYLLQSNLQLFG